MSEIKLFIKKFLTLSSCFVFFNSAIAQESSGIDSIINNTIQPLTILVSKLIFFTIPVLGTQLPLVVLWLIIGAIFFTGYFNFINIRGFKHSIRLVRGDYANPSHPGEVSHFQALATAVSGTVGVGNIGGVAVAILFG
jgi:AGCS family alanine or glycine:cation symporter